MGSLCSEERRLLALGGRSRASISPEGIMRPVTEGGVRNASKAAGGPVGRKRLKCDQLSQRGAQNEHGIPGSRASD
jgi:hypothetical protein